MRRIQNSYSGHSESNVKHVGENYKIARKNTQKRDSICQSIYYFSTKSSIISKHFVVMIQPYGQKLSV